MCRSATELDSRTASRDAEFAARPQKQARVAADSGASIVTVTAEDGSEPWLTADTMTHSTRVPRAPSAARSRVIPVEEIRAHFHMPINDAAGKMGVCATVLKQQCRDYGIHRWPFRKVRKLDKLLVVLGHSRVQGTTEAAETAAAIARAKVPDDTRKRKLEMVKEALTEVIVDPNCAAHLKVGKLRCSSNPTGTGTGTGTINTTATTGIINYNAIATATATATNNAPAPTNTTRTTATTSATTPTTSGLRVVSHVPQQACCYAPSPLLPQADTRSSNRALQETSFETSSNSNKAWQAASCPTLLPPCSAPSPVPFPHSFLPSIRPCFSMPTVPAAPPRPAPATFLLLPPLPSYPAAPTHAPPPPFAMRPGSNNSVCNEQQVKPQVDFQVASGSGTSGVTNQSYLQAQASDFQQDGAPEPHTGLPTPGFPSPLAWSSSRESCSTAATVRAASATAATVRAAAATAAAATAATIAAAPAPVFSSSSTANAAELDLLSQLSAESQATSQSRSIEGASEAMPPRVCLRGEAMPPRVCLRGEAMPPRVCATVVAAAPTPEHQRNHLEQPQPHDPLSLSLSLATPLRVNEGWRPVSLEGSAGECTNKGGWSSLEGFLPMPAVPLHLLRAQ